MEMAQEWPLLQALSGGTSAMRSAREMFLPKQPREEVADYEYRVKVSTLFPIFNRTVSVMAGKPFAKPVTLTDSTPQIDEYLNDVDMQGRDLHSFSASLFDAAIRYGLAGVMVDYTRVPSSVQTLAEERSIGARPYFVHIRHDQILGWKIQEIQGAAKLTQLRIAESAEVDDGEYGVAIKKRVRVHYRGRWELYQEPDKGGEYTLIDQGVTANVQDIPFVPFYGRRLGLMMGQSPLLDLAHLNVKHWQEQSDQDDSTRFARKRLLVFSGVSDSDMTTVTASSSSALRFDNVGSTVQVVQGSAESVTVGRSEIAALEAQCIQTGAELMVSQAGSRTATEDQNDAEANKSELLRIVESFEDALNQCFVYMAEWIGSQQVPTVQLFKDFTALTLAEASAQLLLQVNQAGKLSDESLFEQLQRRGILSPDVKWADEKERIENQGTALGAL